jgi:hypothetical protein
MELQISQYFVNHRGLCYAVEVSLSRPGGKKARRFIWPVKYSQIPPHIEKEKRTFSPYKRSDIDISFEDLKDIVEKYNHWVVEISEEKGLYQISPEESEYKSELNQRETKILPLYPLIKIERFLALEKNVIGFASRGLYYYFKPEDFSRPANYARLIKSAKQGYSLLMEGFLKISTKYSLYYLMHDPDKINKVLASGNKEEDDPLAKDAYAAFYSKYLYNLFVIELISSLDEERDTKTRGRIRKLIGETNFRNTHELNKFYEQLGKILPEPSQADDVMQIKRLVEQSLLEYFDKKKVISIVEQEVYNFDRLTLHQWKLLSNDYETKSADQREKAKNALMKEITRVVKDGDVFQLSDSMRRDGEKGANAFPNIFVPCSSFDTAQKSNEADDRPSYCVARGGKMVLPRDQIPVLVDLFAADLCNPLKRDYLLSSIILGNIRDFFRFSRVQGEDIYVKWM